MICQKKNKRLHVFCLSFLLFCLAVIPCLFSVRSYASETTTQTVDQYFREHNFYDTCAYVCRKYASFPYNDYLTGSSSGIIYDNFADYLEEKGKSNLLQEDVTITGTGGGRGYDIPQEVRQEMLNFVQEVYIDQNPLSYTQCYIYSYNFIDAQQFWTYAQFQGVKTFISQQDGYVFIRKNAGFTDLRGGGFACVIPRSVGLSFVGTTSAGGFTNVQPSINWVVGNVASFASNTNLKWYTFDGNGQFTLTTASSISGQLNQTTKNTSTFTNGANNTVYTSLPKNELVYVFNTLNALKNYNGYAQPFYLPSNSQTSVPYYDGFTDSQLNSAGNFYNNIVINSDNSSPNDIRKTTDSVLGSLDGIFGGSDSESSSGGLFDSLGDIITGATGAISPIKEIVLGDIKDLVADVFDFLPPTIITLWVSGIIFGIFFGVLKLIRG